MRGGVKKAMKDIIKAARLERKMTQTDLAEKLGVTQTTVCFWETGVNLPPTKMLQPLADALEIPIEKLFGKEAG